MTQQLTQEQFVTFVGGVHLLKVPKAEATGDNGGFYVKITDSTRVPGRFNIQAYGPTGRMSIQTNVSESGLHQAAEALYNAALPWVVQKLSTREIIDALHANGQMVISIPTAEEAAAEQEAYLKAERLEDLHSWLHARYVTAYKTGDVTTEIRTAETLYVIETGLLPEDTREAYNEFEEHLRETVQAALEN